MYPYPSRGRWILADRYSHLADALKAHQAGLRDKILDDRLASLRTADKALFIVTILLSLGVVATVSTTIVGLVPTAGAADRALNGLIAGAAAFTGLFTLAFLLLQRLLGQLEVDILTRVMLRH